LTFLINRSKEKKNGECQVMPRINITGERAALQLQRCLKPKYSDTTRDVIKGRSNQARIFNDYL
jgi:hypothetical protein